MRWTRGCIRKCHARALARVRSLHGPLLREAGRLTRGAAVCVRPRDGALRVELVCDGADGAWACTDERSVWLNVDRPYTPPLLEATLCHEEIHGLVRRTAGGHALSEPVEHLLMGRIAGDLL